MSRLIQRGDDLSSNIELVDVQDNRHLWGQQDNRKLTDMTTAFVPTRALQTSCGA